MSDIPAGLVKLVEPESFDKTAGLGMRLIEDPTALTKSASTIFECDYDDMKPDDKHMGIHVVALGDSEHFGRNRNSDLFPKEACINYHDTFVKRGNVYRHHRNKDPEKRLGQIVKSAYNEPMGRIELFIHAHKDKARDELQKLASEGEISFSMACVVSHDKCTICNALRKSASDPGQCEHLRSHIGEMWDDGRTVGMINDEPKFFDLSFVNRPADRIAWDLKTASGAVVDSVKLARDENIWVPDSVAISTDSAMRKLELVKRAAELESTYAKLASSNSLSHAERYLWELRKAAAGRPDEKTVDALRAFKPSAVFAKLARAGIVFDPKSFFKYAMGDQYEEIALHMPGVLESVKNVFSRMVKENECQTACNDTSFDVDPSGFGYLEVTTGLDKMAADAGFKRLYSDQRIIQCTVDGINPEINVDKTTKIGSNSTQTVEKLAEKYAAYKISAVKAASELDKDTDTDALLACTVAQNLIG